MESCALQGFLTDTQRVRFYEAAAQRQSVRTFCDVPDVAQKSALSYAAARICLPGVRIEMGDCEDTKLYRNMPLVGAVIGTSRYAAIIADASVPHAVVHAGISGEAFVLEAVSLGLGTCWVASFKNGGINVPLDANEKVLAVTPLGVPADPAMRERKRKKLADICAPDPMDWPLWAYNAAECVRMAPSAMNMQPWRISFAGRTLQLQRTGLGGMLDMGIALLHLSLGVQDKAHDIIWGEGREIATLIAEDRA